MSTLGVFTQ
ncbi:unnamed protein product [Medioppia subpectinata]|uniref:Uncharacterized protein n=1 Tax=Medioppia subpectinata TaxID=1979941 RepID=A0A7R9LML8_9ACAR|nr:unnamed protein product [Medioppia subpectinata]CAG2120053.1 unnamed protein product [Medioppia subpectinata]